MQGDQCLDGACYETKINAHIDRELAARPELVQIENGYRSPKEKRPGSRPARTLPRDRTEPTTPTPSRSAPCEAAKPAIIVYGKRVGTTLTVCTDNNCPIHDPRAAARLAQQEQENPDTRDGSQQPRRRPPKKPRSVKPSISSAERTTKPNRTAGLKNAVLQQEKEDARVRGATGRTGRAASQPARGDLRTHHRAMLPKPSPLRSFACVLRALVNLDPYTFTDDLAEEIADENEKRSTEEVLLSVIDGTADRKLTAFALRLALSGHRGIPREGEPDFLSEAEARLCSPGEEGQDTTDKDPKRRRTLPSPSPLPKHKAKKKTTKSRSQPKARSGSQPIDSRALSQKEEDRCSSSATNSKSPSG